MKTCPGISTLLTADVVVVLSAGCSVWITTAMHRKKSACKRVKRAMCFVAVPLRLEVVLFDWLAVAEYSHRGVRLS